MQTPRSSADEGRSLRNLANLFSLWESVGTANGTLETHEGFKKIYNQGSSWPNRIWLTGAQETESAQAALWRACSHLIQTDGPVLLTLTGEQAEAYDPWLEAQGLSVLFSQLAMVLDLQAASLAPSHGELEVVSVTTPAQASLWSRCASEAFGYAVDSLVIQNALQIPGVTFYLGFLSSEVAGTGLLCGHEGVAGFHMAGTRQRLRRRGVAREMMHHLIREAQAGGFSHGTLQASAMGQPLYEQLDFASQFALHNYRFSAGPSR
jgi:GNAT superfamily N-acetyltransferase